MKNPPWKQLKKRVAFASQYLTVRDDEVLRPDKTRGRYAYMAHGGGVGTVVVDAKLHVYLAYEYKYPVRAFGFHLPSGGIEPGESALAAAKRELKEETGFSAKKWEALGEVAATDGSSSEIAYLFLAQGLSHIPVAAIPLEPMEIVRMPLRRAVQMVLNNKITCSYAVTGLIRAAKKLGVVKIT